MDLLAGGGALQQEPELDLTILSLERQCQLNTGFSLM